MLRCHIRLEEIHRPMETCDTCRLIETYCSPRRDWRVVSMLKWREWVDASCWVLVDEERNFCYESNGRSLPSARYFLSHVIPVTTKLPPGLMLLQLVVFVPNKEVPRLIEGEANIQSKPTSTRGVTSNRFSMSSDGSIRLRLQQSVFSNLLARYCSLSL